MKTLKVIAVCMALITLPVLIESCCLGAGSCGCGGNNNWDTNFSITDISLSVEKTATTGGATGGKPTPGPLANHAFIIYLDGEYRTSKLESSFTPTMAAYACSPAPPICDQKITSITVRSNNPLTTTNESFIAGEDLKSLFVVTEYGPMANIINQGINNNRLVFIAQQRRVDVKQTHRFTVNIRLDDNRSFEMETDDLEFTPN